MTVSSEQNNLPAAVRRERMREIIEASEFVPVAELTDRFGVSNVTIRSDLHGLEARGLIRRVRGGAIPTRPSHHVERPYEESLGTNFVEKTAIGKAAAEIVTDGEALILDVGTTTYAVGQALIPRIRRGELRHVVVFTNSLTIAMALEETIPDCTVVVTGGTLRPLQHSLVEPLASVVLEHVNAHTVFLGCTGVHPTRGITNINLPEASTKISMLRTAQRRIVVADGTKIGRVDTGHLCNVDEVDLLITDQGADKETVELLREAGLEVCVAPSERG